MFNEKAILESAKKHNCFYMYDEKKILEYIGNLKNNFEGIEFLYSNKTNPNPKVLETVFSQGFGSDSASINEVFMGQKAGLSKDKIYFSAPGKSEDDIRKALPISVVIADSLTELHRINAVAKSMNIIAEIGIRVNPNFGFCCEAGGSSKFGIDEDILCSNYEDIKMLENLKVNGIHVHLCSQELNAERIKNYYKNMFILAERLVEKLDIKLDFLNLGSGIGINYDKSEVPIDTKDLGTAASEMVKEFKKIMPHTRVFIETGRYVVTKSGIYATKVMDKKISHGKTYVILSNTLNGFIRPAIAHIIPGYSLEMDPCGCEPLFTSRNAFEYIPLTKNTENEVVSLVGNLCTSTDLIADNIEMTKLDIDDVMVMTNAGSYAAVVTPMQFASLNPPAQLFLDKEGNVIETVWLNKVY